MSPFYAAQVKLWPGMQELGDNIMDNISRWQELWIQEVRPSKEEVEKVMARVLKVRESLTAPRSRARTGSAPSSQDSPRVIEARKARASVLASAQAESPRTDIAKSSSKGIRPGGKQARFEDRGNA